MPLEFVTVPAMAGLFLVVVAIFGGNGSVFGINLGREFSMDQRIALGALGVLLIGPGVLGALNVITLS